MTLTLTLTYNLDLQAMVMTYSHAKIQGQRSVSSEDRVQINEWKDRQTEVIVLPPPLVWSVKTKLRDLIYFTAITGLNAVVQVVQCCAVLLVAY